MSIEDIERQLSAVSEKTDAARNTLAALRRDKRNLEAKKRREQARIEAAERNAALRAKGEKYDDLKTAYAALADFTVLTLSGIKFQGGETALVRERDAFPAECHGEINAAIVRNGIKVES